MAFEGVAGTSAATIENNENAQNERIEMNSCQYLNNQSNHNRLMASDPGPNNASEEEEEEEEEEEDDLNESYEEKIEKNMSYRKFIYNNSEQLKCIFGGLLLLMGSGIHISWGIYRVFYLYNCKEENNLYFRFVIWSWYIGAMIGSGFAGYAVHKVRKGRLYFIGGTLLIVSGIFLMLSKNSNIYLVTSRTLGGFTQGIIYVVVVVHASDNATKEFREFLMLIVGAVQNYSILLSVLAFFHTDGLLESCVLNGLGLILFGMTSSIITTKHATETVSFILQNDGCELDALKTVSKLKKQPIAARSVHHDFLITKNLVHDEIEKNGLPEFKKVLLPDNRKSLIFCCYGRLCSVLSFNLPFIVMIMLFLRRWADYHFDKPKHHGEDYCLGFIGEDIENVRYHGENIEEFAEHKVHEKGYEIGAASPTTLTHLIIFLHSRELTLVLSASFIFGTITNAILYKLNIKRFIYYISCVLSSVLVVTGIAYSFQFFTDIFHFCLIVYFNYVTIPIDLFGHCMLAESFPITLKCFSVAFVAIIEHLVHILVIALYLSEWFHDSIILLMCIVAFISHEIARNLPQKDNLPVAVAGEQ